MQQESSDRKKLLKNRIWLIFPILHWCLSFVYERLIFKWNADSWNMYLTKSLSDNVSNTAQSIMLYCFGKIIAAVLIFLLWKGIYSLIKKYIPTRSAVVFLIICVVVGVFLAFCWPWSFDWQDTYTLYAYAVNMLPWYWHHFLTSALFVGSLMVFPVPFAISLLQFLSFAAFMTYVYYRIEKLFRLVLPVRLVIFVIFLIPDTYLLLTQAYRNCFYTIIGMYYVAEICFDSIEAGRNVTEKVNSEGDGTTRKARLIRLAILIVLGAVLSVWRTEGILIGIVGTAIILFKTYRLTARERIIGAVAFAGAVAILTVPQKIGDEKYYNNDYIAMSTIEGLQAVLNSSDINLDYEGAQEDLVAIDAYVPLDYIKQYGIVGKRSWFYENGNADFDQSCASAEVQSGYLKAVVRLVIHNPKPYIKKQLNYTLKALGINRSFSLEEYRGPETGGDTVQYTIHEVGHDEVYEHPIVTAWLNSTAYNTVGMKIHEINSLWKIYFEKLKLMPIIRVLVLLADVVIVVAELIRWIRKKRERSAIGFFAFLLLAQFAIIAMTVPSYYSLYFFSVLFISVTLQIIYAFDIFGGRDGSGKRFQENNKK